MKKFIIIAIIGLMVIVALFENTGEDVSEELEAETKTEQTSDKDDNKSRSEMTDEDKAEAKQKYEEEKAEEEQKAKEKAEAERKQEEKKAEQEAADKEDAETLFLQIMRESVGSYVDIQFDKSNKIYTMTPTDQGLIDEISMLPMGIGHDNWGVLVDGMASMSKSGKDLVGEGYTINLVNPLNHENVILWIVDGEVIYNVIDDL